VYLRMSPDFTSQDNKKCGAVNKSEALAPTYPQFVMRNLDLCSSFKSSVRLK